MTNIIKLLALLFAVAAAVFYCKMSNAHWGTDICQNQAMTAADGCDVYVITD